MVRFTKACAAQPSQCDEKELCIKSVDTDWFGEVIWSGSKVFQPFVGKAKKRSLNCGVNFTKKRRLIVNHSADYEFNPIDCSFTATIRSQGSNAVEEKLQFFYNGQKNFYVADDFDLAKVTKRYFFH